MVEPKGRLWIEGEDLIPPEGKRVTWGVTVTPDKMPQYWKFHIICHANTSIWVKGFWDKPERIMYEKFGDNIDEIVYIRLYDPDHHKKWTWYIDNTGEHTASIKNFTVIYEGALKPNEIKGNNFIIVGGSLTVISITLFLIFRKRVIY
ncbi:hypothetical protein [[Eubacterium] cellulosolvens]